MGSEDLFSEEVKKDLFNNGSYSFNDKSYSYGEKLYSSGRSPLPTGRQESREPQVHKLYKLEQSSNGMSSIDDLFSGKEEFMKELLQNELYEYHEGNKDLHDAIYSDCLRGIEGGVSNLLLHETSTDIRVLANRLFYSKYIRESVLSSLEGDAFIKKQWSQPVVESFCDSMAHEADENYRLYITRKVFPSIS